MTAFKKRIRRKTGPRPACLTARVHLPRPMRLPLLALIPLLALLAPVVRAQSPGAVSIDLGYAPSFLAPGDFNADGVTDFANARNDSDLFVVFGLGAGAYGTPQTFPLLDKNQALIAADFNNDTYDDIATANNDGVGLSIVMNNGDGTFAAPTQPATTVDGRDIVAAHFNGDAFLDLAVCLPDNNRILMLAGQGDGTFQNIPNDVRTEVDPIFLTAGDLNHDDKTDLVAVCGYVAWMTVFMGNGDGTLGPPIHVYLDIFGNRATIADVDRDGHPDILTTTNWPGYETVIFVKGHGDGTFDEPSIAYEKNGHAYNYVAADFNRDGLLDMLVQRYDSLPQTYSVSFMLGRGNGRFYEQRSADSEYSRLSQMFARDFNNDGILDLAGLDTTAHQLKIFFNPTFPRNAARHWREY